MWSEHLLLDMQSSTSSSTTSFAAVSDNNNNNNNAAPPSAWGSPVIAKFNEDNNWGWDKEPDIPSGEDGWGPPGPIEPTPLVIPAPVVENVVK
jgi:hypothetical protein